MLAYLEEEKGDGGLLVGVKTFDSVLALFDGPATLGLWRGESLMTCTESVSDDISITSQSLMLNQVHPPHGTVKLKFPLEISAKVQQARESTERGVLSNTATCKKLSS